MLSGCILDCVPSEGFRSIGHHSYAQLDGFTDGESKVLIAIAKI